MHEGHINILKIAKKDSDLRNLKMSEIKKKTFFALLIENDSILSIGKKKIDKKINGLKRREIIKKNFKYYI